jgi:dynein heavy chain
VIVKRTETIQKSELFMSLDRMIQEMYDRTVVFFIRSFDGPVPKIADSSDPTVLASQFEFNVMHGEVLQGIASIMHHLYLPVVQKVKTATAETEEKKTSGGSEANLALRHELNLNIAKFEQQIRHVVVQSRGDTRLNIPNITISSPVAAIEDAHLVTEIESALENWIAVIAAAVEAEHQKMTKTSRSPLGEIEFWRDRNANLSALFDQINAPKVQMMVEVMKLIDSPQVNSFNYHFGELAKLYLEARDNVKFLTTLERHFKHISEGSFQTILESMQSMVNGLRMVWVISRHYNTDERMAPLMENIAETLARRVREGIRLSEVLAMDIRQSRKLVTEAKDVLTSWSENYFRMRKRIEDSGSDHRWEFDRKALFSKTDYMSEICGNILEIIEAIEHFRVFLGPELKAVTGDSAGIDEVIKRVENLTAPLKIPLEEKIFDKSFEKNWENIMKKFRSSVSEIEKMTEQFIKESFRKLRSAEGAFELVKNFQKIGTSNNAMTPGAGTERNVSGVQAGSSIQQQISDRYKDILEQYMNELATVKHLFLKFKDRPHLYKNFPPVAGAITWARDLYHRAKRPILRFKKHGGLLEDEFGESVKATYLEFAKMVDNYITDLYNDWEGSVSSVVMEKLRTPVLCSIAPVIPKQCLPNATTNAKEANQSAPTFILPPPPYRVNFSYDLRMIIKESKYLDKKGFRVPEAALNVTLQEKKYLEITRSLNEKLHEYDRLMTILTPVEKKLLQSHIDQLNTTIKGGFHPLNWTSQRIPAYIEELRSALEQFGSVVSQVHKNADMINDIVKKISKTLLIKPSDFRLVDGSLHPLDISEFFEIAEKRRNERLDSLVHDYKTIGESFLMKVEEVVAKTGSGSSSVLAVYYHYWERCLYNAITEMVISSMATYIAMLQCKEGSPLFKLNVSLNGKELLISPSLTEIDKLITKGARNLVESAKFFVRWMHGTCLQTDPQVINEDEEPVVFSFFQDISQNPQVVKLAISLTSQTNKVYSITNKYLDGWRRYDKVTGLWNPKRKQQIEKIRTTCDNLDSAMSYFQSIKETVESQSVVKDIDFLQIDMTSVSIGVAKQAELWKNDYGEVLLTTSRSIFNKLQEKMTTLEQQVGAETADLEQLKFLLNVIAEIQNVTQDVELEMMDITERYRTMKRYRIAVPEQEMQDALTIEKRWHTLYCDSRTRDLRLIDTKAQFREVTRQQDIDFRELLTTLRKEFLDSGPGVSSTTLDDGVELLADYKRKLVKFNKIKLELINAQNLFNLDVKAYPDLQQTQADVDQLSKIYDFYSQFKEFQLNMSSMLWGDLDISILQNGADTFEKSAKKFPKDLKEIFTFKMVENKIQHFKEALPLVVSLKNDSMKTRHWQKVMDVTQVTFDVSLKTLTLSNIFSMELHKFSGQIEEIVNEAVQESKIENEVNKIEAAWRNNSLSVAKYKKDGQDRGFVLRAADDLKLELEDNMLNLQTISGSRFVTTFVDRVRKWEKTLNLVSECLEMWFTVQRKWVYLEGIFIGAEDIRQQLPEEAKRFDAIDKQFKTIMTATSKNPNVVDACSTDNRLQTLTTLSDRLDSCQKSLSDYLDTKRTAFPRFFFISDDELLSVLGNSDPTSIQVHLLKLFDNVKEMQFARGNKVIEGMSSVEKEGYICRTPVPVDGPVEHWMTSCEDEMHASLKDITKEGVFNYAKHDRREWLKLVLGMVGLVGSQIWWTWEVEDTFRQVKEGNKYGMKQLESKLTGQLNDLVALVRDKLDSITRKKVNTLLIVDVHARDIVDGFVRESVLNAKEFAWESQLRFYWNREIDDCVIKQCTGTFRYGYEYMGLNGRLVITPLTDRCYMTLTQALTFKLGGSPAGPAGTGKTETVKDLAKSLALPCFVINCGDGLDYKAMGSIFSGLVQVGAWGCFDEFNRINIEVLSVVSAQLRAIQNGLIYDKPTCDIGFGREMTIKRVAGYATCGFFITMNPGYAGRTELPDNLKALFRPVTMIVPDFQQICEIMLFSEGFEGAKILAKKMTVLYKLSKEQLSKQYHYDFGMRALKSVLVMAGGLKRQYQDMPEDLVLMRCLRDSNMPKFVFEDVPLFGGLINDLFPGMDCPRVGYEDLKEAAMNDLEAKGFRTSQEQVFMDQADKVIQMFETQLVRHTTMIVGPTGGGKSLILETLKNARLAAEGVTVKMFVLNPKAQPLKELYGEMDPVTRDWTDGILSKLFRELNDRLPPGKEKEMRWIVYDGDVDALWVENMNSVMDDNKLLTLPNGERIRLQPHCCMICETFDLQYASPATVSRCGMVWVDPKNLGYFPYYERWIRLRFGNGVLISEEKQAGADFLLGLYEKYVPKCVEMILSGIVDGEMGQRLKQVIPIKNIDMVKQLCSLLDAFLVPEVVDQMDVEHVYIFCCVWSLGGQLIGESKAKFDSYLKRISREPLPDSLLYDFYYDPTVHKWEKWQSQVPKYAEPSPFKFYEVMVPTTDSVIYTHLLKNLAPLRPILFVGESGTAKTTIIQKYLLTLPSTSSSKLNMNFSSRTTAADVQTNIEANVDKRSGNIYGPPAGKKLIVFIDDLNMPKVDTYGTQQPIALLLFLIGRGCVYDREKDLNLKLMKDLQYIGAMGPPGGGRNPVDTRFIALFNVFNLTPPTNVVLNNIYSSIINIRYAEFSEGVKAAAGKITSCTLRLFSFIIDKMPPTPSKFHYM